MRILFAGALLCSLSLAGCDALDTKEDLNLTDEMMATRRYQMFDWGYRVYEHIPYGFTAIDGNLFAAVSDEAQYVTTFSSTQRFNEGSWSAYYNPDDCYTSYYNGIYAAHDYLDKSVDYRYILGMHRDTLTSNGLDSYRRDIVDVQRLRAEAHVLKAYYYFELAKRYGGVPLIDRVYADQKEANLPRGTFDEVVGLILREIEGVRNELVVDWRAENLEEKSGRITRGAALALKSRVLLYAASPQFNPSGEKSKWAAAAAAAFAGESGRMIALKRVSNYPYQCITESVDVQQVANLEKKVPLEWITPDGMQVTEAFEEYARPLILDEVTPVYVNGTPRHIRL